MIVVIPMAGRGSRFSERGWNVPKPLIEVAGRPMVLWALESARGLDVSAFIFILLEEHEQEYEVSKLIRAQTDRPVHFITIPEVTEGQLCTVLAAGDLIDTPEDVLIMAADTLVIGPQLARDIRSAKRLGRHGLISVAELPGDRWSFARADEKGRVVEVAEKIRISDHASTGLYYFSRGDLLVAFGKEMIRRQEKTRGEYYVIPVYQLMIDQGGEIGISRVEAMWDMGTPEAKAKFEEQLSVIQSQLR